MRVLVADDDPASRRLVERTLSKSGYDVLLCSDGLEAWETLRGEEAPEVAILDWMMPGMDGPELCRRVREEPNAASTHIILLTAKGSAEDVVVGLNAGADDYVSKPFDPGELGARVRVAERLTKTRRQQLNQETASYVEQLDLALAEVQRSRRRVFAVQEDVRRNVAEELHGPVQSKLSVLVSKLGDIREMIDDSSREVQRDLAETAAELDGVRENEIRMMSHGLHTSILNVGLQAGIKTLRDQFERHVPIEIAIAENVMERDLQGSSAIPFDTRVGLYRVAHEALANVVKHADATRVAIGLSLADNAEMMKLSVEDDGGGFEPDSVQRGLGMATMEDYIGALGGTLQVDTAPGKGTIITASVPLS